MNETTFTLSQKAILQIQPMEEPRPSFQLLEFLQCLVYDAVRQEYGFEPDWERFRSYGAEETPDQTKRIQTATLYGEEDEALRQWALRLSLRDGNVRRRKWLLHIGIDVRKPDTAMQKLNMESPAASEKMSLTGLENSLIMIVDIRIALAFPVLSASVAKSGILRQHPTNDMIPRKHYATPRGGQPCGGRKQSA